MQDLQSISHFIGRTGEIDMFMRWLADPNAPWILYVHDAFEEPDKKGGIGKTWLLKKWAESIQQTRPDIAVVMIDFFNIADRDGIAIAERIIAALQTLYPAWSPTSFRQALEQYHDSESTDAADTNFRNELASALVTDLHQLDQLLLLATKSLLVCFDTFEAIEHNPNVAVLRLSQTFPDDYQFECMRVVVAGRNALDWTHPNWAGREQEVLSFPLPPFNQQEMLHFIEAGSFYRIPPQGTLAHALHERTEGRPILIGLAVDMLNHRILTLDELITIPKIEFEKYLVTRINQLENPLNWVILFMAHVYHRFNIHILEWIVSDELALAELWQEITSLNPIALLQQLSFVRQSGTGDDYALHDEMRRLVTKYCWSVQDPDGRSRKEISNSIIRYYEQEKVELLNGWVQRYPIVEILYHRLFVEIDDGLAYFQHQFQGALRFLKTTFARLLLQEVQKFSSFLSSAQRNDALLAEARLLRAEVDPTAALNVLERLKVEVDPQWYEEHQADVLMEEGRCYKQQGKLLEATNSFTQCLTIHQEQGNELESAQLLNNLGFIFRRRGQLLIALSYYEKSIALYKKLGMQNEYASLLANISNVYRRQGKIEEALRSSKIAWRIRLDSFQTGKISEVLVGLSLHTLGMTYQEAGNIVDAEHRFQEAFDIYQRMNYKVGIATTYNRFGQIQFAKGDLDGAREWFVKAEEASRDIDVEQSINSLNKQGRICVLKNRWQEAIAFFERAIASAQEAPDYYQQTESLIDLAETLALHTQQHERSQQLLQKAEEIARREDYLSLLGLIEQTRGKIYYRGNNYQLAFQHFALYCHYMAQYNSSEFSLAVQMLVDTLLEIPKQQVPAIVKELFAYWHTHQLDGNYPELVRAVKEVDDFMGL